MKIVLVKLTLKRLKWILLEEYLKYVRDELRFLVDYNALVVLLPTYYSFVAGIPHNPDKLSQEWSKFLEIDLPWNLGNISFNRIWFVRKLGHS